MKDCTDIIAILDRSGSMGSIRTDTVGGFNSFVKDQQEIPGECNLSLYDFDDRYEVVYENKPIADVLALSLHPRGCTALLDAIGKTINARGEYYASLPEEERPSRIVVLIMTDGQENASHEFTIEQIKKMVTEQQDTYKWQFIFLGANIDSFSVAGGMGIHAAMTMDFAADSKGVAATYAATSRSVSAYRLHDASAGLQGFTEEDRVAAKNAE